LTGVASSPSRATTIIARRAYLALEDNFMETISS
jgi:hypothetical protein